MADLAVGLSKSVVAGAITKVQSAIAEDAKLRQQVKRDLVFITLELEMMNSFLDDANKEMKNNLVRTWVKHICQLVYDVEDCVENVVHLDNKPIFWRRFLPSFMAPALPLDLAVEEIQQLKGRVEDVNNCYRRYNRINIDSAGAGSNSAAVMLLHPHLPLPGASDMLAEARDATKRHHGALGDLTQLITNKVDDSLQVISVWGAGGDHEVTSIIRKTYNDPLIGETYAYRSWVKVMHPFNPHDITRSLIAQFYANYCKEQRSTVLRKMAATQEDLFNEIEKIVTEKKYLIVLEGLSDMPCWDAVRAILPDMKNGSSIIVSTQQPEIASLCIGQSYSVLELKRFSAEHSVCAFFKESGVREPSQISSYQEVSFKWGNLSGWMTDTDFVGRDKEIYELQTYPTKALFSKSQVMSVWGMAGVGKSALVRNLYDHNKRLHNEYFNKYTWVDVSHPFNLRGFSRSLLLDFYSGNDPIQECRQLLENYRCLIVIDDVRTKEEWDLIRATLVSGPSKSVIIVITTEASIAAYCTGNEELMFNVQGLEADAAIRLLKKEVSRKYPFDTSLTHVASWELQELISKCGGLPRVIVQIANSLPTWTVTSVETIRSLNHNFIHHLENNLEFDNLRGLFRWMHSIILNPPDFLKPCLFYLSIFPRDKIIRQRRLVRRWVAEGYSQESVEKHAKENAETFFSDLVQLSIFQTTRLGLYKVNGFIHEYIVSRQMEENLVFELDYSFAATTKHQGRHLIIREYWERDIIVFESIDFTRLRSLTVFGTWESFFISKSMKILRVLDLEDAHGVTDGDLEKMVKLLRRLKFLSLRGCSGIYHLPSSLGDLRHLQTLDIRHTSIVTLPVSIIGSQELQYIRAGTTIGASTPPYVSSSWFCRHRHNVGLEVPRGIGKLTALHTLGVVNVSASGGKAIVEELKKLTQLRKLGVSGINKHNAKDFAYAVHDHVHLQYLSLQLDKENECCLDDLPIGWTNLRSLKFYGLGAKLPQHINCHGKLSKLNLEMVILEQNDIEFLAYLPVLCILRICVKQPHLHFYAEMCGEQLSTFKAVKILELTCRSSRLHVTFGSKTMKNMELLKIDCSNASYQITGLNYLRELKTVLLKGTRDEALKTEFQRQLDDHPRRPAVKLVELSSS